MSFYLEHIYNSERLTNNGPLVQELTQRLEDYLGVENLLLVSNGTLALQIAYRALDISGNQGPTEAITTPFTFIATASSLQWEGITPVFVDIEPNTWNLDPALIEGAITPHTRAIVPVHVFGNPCDVEAIQTIAHQHGLMVIYDAAHAFGVRHRGESVLRWGDAATLSFHATKVFHTIEGGAIIFRRREDLERAQRMINFGITGPETIDELGINAKMNEFQAAMGLSVLDEMDVNLASRKTAWDAYHGALKTAFSLQKREAIDDNNYAYFPILSDGETTTKGLEARLKERDIHARRYFYPSLDTLKNTTGCGECPVSRNIANRVLCLPLYSGLDQETVIRITNILLARSPSQGPSQ